MCQYLVAALRPRQPARAAVRPDEPGFGAWLNWLHHGEATLTFPQTIVLRYGRFEPDERKLPQAADDYAKWFIATPARHRRGAAGSDAFLAADRFTVADISVGYALMLANELDLVPRFPAAVAAYWERLQQARRLPRALAAQHDAAVAQGVSPWTSTRPPPVGVCPMAPPTCSHRRRPGPACITKRAWTSTTRCSRAWRCRWCCRSGPPACCAPSSAGCMAGAGPAAGVAPAILVASAWVLGWQMWPGELTEELPWIYAVGRLARHRPGRHAGR